jgi:hypothetical protein
MASGPRRFVPLWELPVAQLESVTVAALHGGGYRAVAAEADPAQPDGCACTLALALAMR